MAAIALHRVRFNLGSGIWIEIETVLGTAGDAPEGFAPPGLMEVAGEADAKLVESGGMLPMCWRDAGQLFEPFQLREDTSYYVDIRVPMTFDDALRAAAEAPEWPLLPRLAKVFTREPNKRWARGAPGGPPETIVRGQIRLKSHAGVIGLGTALGGSLFAEVVCRKLNYFDEFKALLDSLADKAAELLLSFDSPVSLSFDSSGELAENDAALHFLMRHIMSKPNLPTALEEIFARPHSRLVERVETVAIEEIEEVEPDLVADGLDMDRLMRGGPLARMFRGFTPTMLPQRETFESLDTAENRYAKALLEHCSLLSSRLAGRMAITRSRAADREVRTWAAELDEMLKQNMWREVGPLGLIPANSQVLQRRRGYKELFRFDLSLRMGLSLAWRQGREMSDGLAGDVRPVSELYEYWCFFVLREILSSICPEIGGGDFLRVSSDSLSVRLERGKSSECRFRFQPDSGPAVLVSLFYNRRFLRQQNEEKEWSGSYSACFTPDFSVRARAEGTAMATHWLHFDAKYRLDRREAAMLFVDESAEDAEDDTSSGQQDVETSRVHKKDDLFKMHTYRDGILSTRGAYVLFPGDDVGGITQGPSPNLFIRHPSAIRAASEHRLPSVGAFGLAPGKGPEQAVAIKTLLMTALNLAARITPYREEEADYPEPLARP